MKTIYWYIIATGTREYELRGTFVLPWLLGYLARMDENPETAELATRTIADIAPLPAETNCQTCYRVLKICHDRGIIVYRGIRREKP